MPDFGRWTSTGGDPSLNEINRTDRFLDALANQEPVYSTDPSEAELAQLLSGWRDEIRTPPLMSPVTPRDAVAALTRAVDSRKRTRMSMAVAGSVAAAVLCIGGFGAVVASSGPGDSLYGLRTALFGEQTRTDQITLASQQLAEVQQLIDKGQWQAAQDKLQAVTTTVATVNDVEQKQQLVTQWQDLTVKVDAKNPNATLPPGVPPPVMPEPVVVATESTTSPETAGPTSSSAETTTISPSEATSPATTTSPPTTTSQAPSSPAAEPPPPSSAPTTTMTSPPATSTPTTATTTTHAVTTTTTTTQAPVPPVAGPAAGGTPPVGGESPGVVGGAPAAGAGAPSTGTGSPVGGGAQVVGPPTAAPTEAAPARGGESPATQSQVTQNPVTQNQPAVSVPVTTTTMEMPPPKKQGGDGQ